MRTLAAVSFSLLLAGSALAQSAEYGRDSAGTLDMTTKQARLFSGSLSVSSMNGLGATVGGTAVKDRVWFFASADRRSELFRTAVPATMSDITASFAHRTSLKLPKDFLSLHATSVLSPGSFVSVNVSQSRQ